MRTKLISESKQNIEDKLLILNGGQRRDRTADAGLFRTNRSCIHNNLDDTDGTVSHKKSQEAPLIVILGYVAESR